MVPNPKAFKCFGGFKLGGNKQDPGTLQSLSKRRGKEGPPPRNEVTGDGLFVPGGEDF